MSKPKQSTITYPTVRIVSEDEGSNDLIVHADKLVPLEDAFQLNEEDPDMRNFILNERAPEESKFKKKGLYLGNYSNGVDYIVVREEDDSLTLLPVYRK